MSFGRNTDNTDFNPRSGTDQDFNALAGNNQAGFDQSLGGRTAERHAQAQGNTNPDPMSAFDKHTGTGDSNDYNTSSRRDFNSQTGSNRYDQSSGLTGDQHTSTMNPDPMGTSRTSHQGGISSGTGMSATDYGSSNAGRSQGLGSTEAQYGSSGKGMSATDYDSSTTGRGTGQNIGSTEAQYGSSGIGSGKGMSATDYGSSTTGHAQGIGSDQYGSGLSDKTSGTDYSSTGQRGMGTGMEESQFGTKGRKMEGTGMGIATGHGGMDTHEKTHGSHGLTGSGTGTGASGMTGPGGEYQSVQTGRGMDSTTGTGMGRKDQHHTTGGTGTHISGTGEQFGTGTGTTGSGTHTGRSGVEGERTGPGTTGTGTYTGRTDQFGKSGVESQHGTTGSGAHTTSSTGASKPSVTDKIAGKLEMAAGKVSGNPAMVEKGQERATGEKFAEKHVN